MDYSENEHITRDELADIFSIPASRTTQIMRKRGGPQEIGAMVVRDAITRNIRTVQYYDRTTALRWMEKCLLVSTPVKRHVEKVKPFIVNRMARETWRPKDMLAINMARADAAYEGRGFVSAGGVGNGVEHAHGYARGT